MRLNELRETSYEIAKSKGWHDPEFDTATFADRMALVISELAEALEEHRRGNSPTRIYFKSKESEGSVVLARTPLDYAAAGNKPEGVIIELADAMIRIGDCAGKHEIDLEHADPVLEEDTTSIARLVRGSKCPPLAPSFGAWMCQVSHALSLAAVSGDEDKGRRTLLVWATQELGHMVHWLGITPEEFAHAIAVKHAYNRTRPFRHGGKKL